MKTQQLTAIFVVVVIAICCEKILAKKRHRDRLPIQDLDELNHVRHFDSKKKASECRFGDKRFELEETWHPDLGPPFGVMHCVHCECVPIHKKRRIVGRVRCKNIKSDCPKPTCPDPVLLQGRCCKVCPGQLNNPDLMIEVDLKREEEEKNGRHYAALLGPGTSLIPTKSTSVAAGRFYFRKKTLTYSFVTNPEFGWPKLLTFLDGDGNIIEEFPLQTSPFQNFTGKICGSWNRLPRRYRRQLRRDQIFAQLTSSVTGSVISGRIGKYYGLGSELFSSLLRSETGDTGAGTAITSLSTSATGTGSIHVMLLLSEIFGEEENGAKDVPIQITFETGFEHETRIVTEDLVVPKASNELTTIDFKTVFDGPELMALGQGRLKMTVTSKNYPERRISSTLVPRFSCDFFDTPLTPFTNQFSENENNENSELVTVDSGARGLAWMFMTREGKIKYHIKLNDLSSKVVSIQIDNGRKSRRLLKIVGELLPSYSHETGWANGTLSLPAQYIEYLYQEDLYLNVETEKYDHELRGRFIQQLKQDAHENGEPLLLKGNQTTITGIGWVDIDTTCTLNYQVRLTGVGKKMDSHLQLEDYPMRNLKTLPLFPEKHLSLQKFRGVEADGHADGLHKLTMARLDSGDAALVVSSITNEESLAPFRISGKITNVRAPPDCLPRYRRNELELMPGYLSDLGEEQRTGKENTRCLYQEHYMYEDGDQWTATHKPCSMCSCRRGVVVCDKIVCPKTTCSNPMILEGECCATCPSDMPSDNTLGCFFQGDKKFHIAGTKWHPYIPPFGFSRCAICTCEADTLNVKCTSKKCPELPCPEEAQIRPDALACCKVCSNVTEGESDIEILKEADPNRPHDMGQKRTEVDILREGGCDWRGDIYANGDSWHPKVLPFGEMKCVTCKCKDGQTKCSKKPCPELTCHYKIQDKDECCPRCALTKEEVRKVRKIRRLMKIRKIRRMRKQKQQQKEVLAAAAAAEESQEKKTRI